MNYILTPSVQQAPDACRICMEPETFEEVQILPSAEVSALKTQDSEDMPCTIADVSADVVEVDGPSISAQIVGREEFFVLRDEHRTVAALKIVESVHCCLVEIGYSLALVSLSWAF